MAVIRDLLRRGNGVDFDAVNRAALPYLSSLVREWCPNGKMCGHEYVALNPTRVDARLGSFSINTRSGAWSDFATGDAGGDPVSLAAYIFGTSQAEAARTLAAVLGVRPG
jgi:hypothetical protein